MTKQEILDLCDFKDGDKVWIVVERDAPAGKDTCQRIRVNVGFTATELLGLLSLATHEIIAQIRGEIKPTILTSRVAVVEGVEAEKGEEQ